MTLPTPNGFTGDLFFEELLRKFLAAMFIKISQQAADPNVQIIDEMFARYGDEIRLQVRNWFIANTNIKVVINYPKLDIGLPFVAVVNANEAETDKPYIGDYGGAMTMGADDVTSSTTAVGLFGRPLTDERPKATGYRKMISVPEIKTTQIWVGTDDPNSTLYLYTITKMLLILNKMDFDKYVGARNMRLSGSDLQHHPEFLPQMVYMKQLTLNYEMNFDIPLARQNVVPSASVSLADFLGVPLNGG